jgi:hypothetical protein
MQYLQTRILELFSSEGSLKHNLYQITISENKIMYTKIVIFYIFYINLL